MLHVLFVCTGNTCRSPMAESMLSHWAQKEGLPVQVQSAGIAASYDVPVSGHSVRVLKNRGLQPVSSSQPVNDNLVQWADVILTMTMHHKKLILEQYPDAMEKVFTLKEYIHDDPVVGEKLKRLDELYSELEMKQALFIAKHRDDIGELEQKRARLEQQLDQTEEELAKWRERLMDHIEEERAEIEKLEKELPNFDIHDPFGGSQDKYEQCAVELERELRKLMKKLAAMIDQR